MRALLANRDVLVVLRQERVRSPAASELSRQRKLSVNSINMPGNL